MDIRTGNIYTREEAELLGIPTPDLIPLTDQQAQEIIRERTALVGDDVDALLERLEDEKHRARSMKQPTGMPWDR